MAFSWAGDLTGAKPIRRFFEVGATVYPGQLVGYDAAVPPATYGGQVSTMPVPAAGPDITSWFMGICTGMKQAGDATYNSTYKGDSLAYTVTQASLAGYDPADAVQAEVILITPTTLIHGPVVHTTVGTAPHVITNTAASAGVTITHTAIDTTVDGYSTLYCRTGLNRGIYRTVTTVTSTAVETVVIPFPYAIAVGDTFVVANVARGVSHLYLDSQFQGILSNNALTAWYKAYVHELNLAEAGKEYAVFTLSAAHLIIGGTGI